MGDPQMYGTEVEDPSFSESNSNITSPTNSEYGFCVRILAVGCIPILPRAWLIARCFCLFQLLPQSALLCLVVFSVVYLYITPRSTVLELL
jgi:hypothetical protein